MPCCCYRVAGRLWRLLPLCHCSRLRPGVRLHSVPDTISQRKLKHIEVCLDYPVEFSTQTTGLEHLLWPYCALPECSLHDIDLACTFLGKPLSAPILIGAMTGGAERAARINRHLAEAAEHLGIGLMLGSQRVMLESEAARASFLVRQYAPNALIIGNLGVAQLNKGYGLAKIQQAVTLIEADALALHVNPLQEALQIGGDTDFRALTPKMRELVPQTGFPVILKEVGPGLSGAVARSVADVGFAALDVAGAGGTSWAKVEDFAHHGYLKHPDVVEIGIPTAQALRQCHAALPAMPLIASGGIRSGLDMAKSLLLGATVAATAKPLLAPAIESTAAVIAVLEQFIFELKTALFVAGFASLADLHAARTLQKPSLTGDNHA
jgi:isopentenyl-diphosphate Delta-isomerase